MADSDLSSLAEVVPQLSYEIIARVVPGTTILLSLFAAAQGPARAAKWVDTAIIHPDTALSGWTVVLFGIAAYVLAIILDGVWQILKRVRPASCPSDSKEPTDSFKFNVVNQTFPKAGSWVTKLYAETNGTHVLVIGWAISALVNLYYLVTAFSMGRLWLEIALLVGTVGMVSACASITATRTDSLNILWQLAREGASAAETED